MRNDKVDSKLTNKKLLLYFLKGSILLFVLGMIASGLATFLGTVVPKIINFTIDSVLGVEPVMTEFGGAVALFGGIENIRQNVWIVAVAIMIIAAVTLVFRYCGIYFNNRGNQTLVRRMRDTLFSHIHRISLSVLNKHNTGDLIQRCTSDVDAISNFVSNQLVSLVRITLMFALSLVFMFTINVKLAAIAAAFVPVIVGYSGVFFVRAHKKFKKCDEEEGVLSTIAQENLTGVRVVRAFGRERLERDKFEKQNQYYTELWIKTDKAMALFWTVSDLIAAVQLLFIIIMGTVFCVGGEMTAGNLVAFVSYNTMMIGPVRQLGRIISNLSRANVALGRISEIMTAPEERYGEDEGTLGGDIVFDNVTFEYEKDKPVLRGVSFTVPQGSTLGIIGGTGSGKSTIVALIDGLYFPSGGTVSFGGRSITDIPPATLRNNVGVVLQEGYIYSRSVAENIAIAAEDKSIENVKRAAAVACVDGNIDGFVDGYDTVVGERGVTLSGGQKQRVAIARTLIRNTPYVVFDDSLSAVDSDTDAKIRANLREMCAGATTVICSHRITTIMHADNIIVLDGGRIVESGNHAELVKAGGIYKRIYDLQMSLPEELLDTQSD